jgi:hypothetical protein
MFSLCIPTMDRFDNYLKTFIKNYLKNPYISEIVISDENGNDALKINQYFPKNIEINQKIKIFVNKNKLGPFFNKLKVCSYATNEWIALIDSDNFADIDYFYKMKQFIESVNPSKNSILSPDYGNDIFQWKHLSSLPVPTNLINRKSYKTLKQIDDIQSKRYNGNTGCISHLMNLGNYVINKFLIDNLDVSGENFLTQNSDCFDVLLFNLLCFEQLDLNFYIINDVKYTHSTSTDSIYLRTIEHLRPYAEKAYNRFYHFFA